MEKLSEKINKNYYLSILALLVFIPLFPKFPLFSVPGTYVAVRIEDFLVAVIFSTWLFINLKNIKNILQDRVIRLISLYFFAGLLAVLSALLITKNVSVNLLFLHYLRRIEYMSLFLIAFVSIKNVQQAKSLLTGLFVATIGVILYGFGQKFFNFPVVSTMNSEFSKGMLLNLSEWARINSTFAGHYDLAAFMVIILCLVMVSFFSEAKIWKKLPLFILLISSFYILLLTESRISFAGYMVSIVLALFLLKKKLFIIPVIILSLVAMVLSGDLSKRYEATLKMDIPFVSSIIEKWQKPKPTPIAVLPTPTPTVPVIPTPIKGKIKPKVTLTLVPSPTILKIQKPESTELAVYRSTEIRLNVEWPRAIRAFTKNPLLGTGFSSITLATDNDYFRALGETGFFGFITFGLIFIEITRRLILFLRKNNDKLARGIVIGVACGAVGFFINASFIDVFEASKLAFIFWILMGIMAAVMDIKIAED